MSDGSLPSESDDESLDFDNQSVILIPKYIECKPNLHRSFDAFEYECFQMTYGAYAKLACNLALSVIPDNVIDVRQVYAP